MTIKSAFLADQLKAIVQAEGLANELSAPAFADVRATLSAHTRFLPDDWIARMRSAAGDARAAWEDRAGSDRTWRAENHSVRELVEAGNLWRREVAGAVAFALATRVPAAKEAARLLDGVGLTVETYELQRAEIGSFVKTLSTLDLDALDLTPEFLQEGRDLAAALQQERSDADRAKGDRAAQTDTLGQALLRIADIAEELAAGRALAERRAGRDLPGFDLTYIRAAAAAHRPDPVADPAPADEAPADDATGRGL